MANEPNGSSSVGGLKLKLNYKRTMTIGFAFFGILLLWQVYDTWCPTFLTQLFCQAMGKDPAANNQDVQYLVGLMMALDNLAALIMLPIFGRLSDKTHTKMGKRMPYILIGTFACAVAFPFIPVLFHFGNLPGTIALMAIVVFFAMMYRNPAVALMPDITPKPLRSKANGIINIMGYFGGAFATVVGLIFVLSNYLGTGKAGDNTWAYHNIWAVEGPFLVGSVLMVVSAIFLAVKIRENELAAKLKDELEEGERQAATVDTVDDDKPLSKANRIMLFFILGAEFLWFMADNGISTFFTNYCIYGLHCESTSSLWATIAGGVASVVGFAFGGYISDKLGRKWTIMLGLGTTILGYLFWIICNSTVQLAATGTNAFGETTYAFPWYILIVWIIKGFGMSLVHVNSFPMVVELCNSKKIGAFTGYYYASSMAAQTITPGLLGLLMLAPGIEWSFLPVYAIILIALAAVCFFFVKSVKNSKTENKHGLEALGDDD